MSIAKDSQEGWSEGQPRRLAEAVRFELTDGRPSLVFKTSALNRSANSPDYIVTTEFSRPTLAGDFRVVTTLVSETRSRIQPLGQRQV